MKICKFGGTSLASKEAIFRVLDIVRSDDERRFVVVSAPGKRYADDVKITDMLFKCHSSLIRGEDGDFDAEFDVVSKRFLSLAQAFNIDDFSDVVNDVKAQIRNVREEAFTASRGEYLCAKLLASVFGFEFVDAADIIEFKDGKLCLDKSVELILSRLAGVKHAIIPGFYGSDDFGRIVTFSRGGSDITGAIVARALNARVYENWTDVDGFLVADPRIVKKARVIPSLSFFEMRKLSYSGACVLHSESVYPLLDTNVRINVRNTFNPDCSGTIIEKNTLPDKEESVVGIACKSGCRMVDILRNSDCSQADFIRNLLSKSKQSVELLSFDIDTLSFAVKGDCLTDKTNSEKALTNNACITASRYIDEMSLIVVVGRNLKSENTLFRLTRALSQCGARVERIDFRASESRVTIAVKDNECKKAVCAIYREFFG